MFLVLSIITCIVIITAILVYIILNIIKNRNTRHYPDKIIKENPDWGNVCKLSLGSCPITVKYSTQDYAIGREFSESMIKDYVYSILFRFNDLSKRWYISPNVALMCINNQGSVRLHNNSNETYVYLSIDIKDDKDESENMPPDIAQLLKRDIDIHILRSHIKSYSNEYAEVKKSNNWINNECIRGVTKNCNNLLYYYIKDYFRIIICINKYRNFDDGRFLDQNGVITYENYINNERN